MLQEVFVRLKILSSDHSPEEIDSFVGLYCDKSWRKGDYRTNTIIKEKNNGWILESKSNKDIPIEVQIRSLFKRVETCRDKIRLLSESNTVEVSCVIYADEVPALYFEKDIITAVSDLGGNLDIDLYVLA